MSHPFPVFLDCQVWQGQDCLWHISQSVEVQWNKKPKLPFAVERQNFPSETLAREALALAREAHFQGVRQNLGDLMHLFMIDVRTQDAGEAPTWHRLIVAAADPLEAVSLPPGTPAGRQARYRSEGRPGRKEWTRELVESWSYEQLVREWNTLAQAIYEDPPPPFADARPAEV